MPDPISNASTAARPAVVGDYRRLGAKLPGVMPTSAPVAPSSGDQWSGRALVAASPNAIARPMDVTPQKGLLASLIDWLASLFGPKPAPTPAPGPAPWPAPNPAPAPQPNPGPIAPPAPQPAPVGNSSTPGIKVFFTNTYGTTNAANDATARPDPNNPDHQLVNLIDSIPPGGTLDGAFFDIGVADVVDALVRAKQRGVNVRLVTENDYYVDKQTGGVRAPIQQLQGAGIQVIPDDRRGLMHDKFLVATGGPSGPTVWTGSYNITDGGSYHDNNNAMEIQSGDLANIYEQEFKKMFEQHNFGTDADGAPHPQSQTVQVGSVQITPYFSPSTKSEAGAKQAILNELAGAHKSIQFLAFSFADKDIGQAMLDKAGQGVKVEGVFETSQAHSRYSTYNQMAPVQGQYNGNLDVTMDGNPALMHHKVIIIDDSTLIMGSFNFSHNAQNENDENMLVIKNAPDLVRQYRAEFARVQAVAKQNGGAPSDGPVDNAGGDAGGDTGVPADPTPVSSSSGSRSHRRKSTVGSY